MGLDNGVVIKNFDKTWEKKFTPMLDWDEEENQHICYWRKCWNVRDVFISVLHMQPDEYEHLIDIEDIDAIYRKFLPLLQKDTWEAGDSVWSFDDYFEHNVYCVINLKMLKLYMEEHPGCEVYFYDSY